MSFIKIRLAELDDLRSIEIIENTCFNKSRRSSRNSLEHSIKSQYQLVVLAEQKHGLNNNVVGAMILYLKKYSLRIFSIGVLPEYQKAGIGFKFLEYAKSVASERGLLSITLEVDMQNVKLVNWYIKHGFMDMNQMLIDYYDKGEHALRLKQLIRYSYNEDKNIDKYRIQNVIVVEKLNDWNFDLESVKVVSAKDYLSNSIYQKNKFIRVFNLCSEYKYQTNGYYVSLIASGRNHHVIPSVTTIIDTLHQTLVQSISDDIDEMIQKNLAGCSEKEFKLKIYFGQTIDEKYKKLANALYKLFEAPLLKVKFIYVKKWVIRYIKPIPIKGVSCDDLPLIKDLVYKYFQRKRFHIKKFKQYIYDIAILYNPDEKTPPSCMKTLKKFIKTGEKLNCYVELIKKDDYSRLLEFDALFIRETTSVRNHTYRFSRKAFSEGLVVIDDPWSILRCSNKIYLHELLTQNKISTPKSWIITKDYLKNRVLMNSFKFPLIIKEPDGSFSIGCFKVNDKDELYSKLVLLLKKSDLLIAQEYLQSEFDWRIGVLDNKPLFACKYYMANKHWQICNWNASNYRYKYGRVETVTLDNVPAIVLDTALRAVRLIDNGLYGVDLKMIGEKVYIIEINDNPNIDDGIENAISKDNLYKKILISFINKIDYAKNFDSIPSYLNFDNSVVSRIGSSFRNSEI